MKPRYIAVDVETTGLRWYQDRLHGFAVAWGPTLEESRYFSVGPEAEGARAALLDPEIDKVGHRVRFDWKFLEQAGFALGGQVWCTKLLQHVLNENEGNGLKELAAKYLGASSLEGKTDLDRMLESLKLAHVGQLCALDLDGKAPPGAGELIARYCREDAVNTWRLFEVLGGKLRELDAKVKEVFQVAVGPLDYYVQESIPTEAVLREVEQAGFKISEQALREYGEELSRELAAEEAALRELVQEDVRPIEEARVAKSLAKLKNPKASRKARVAGEGEFRFNWNSADQLGRLLFDQFGLPVRRAEKGGYSTSEETLQELAKVAAEKELPEKVPQVLSGITSLRAKQKLLGTYVEGFLERAVSGRIYAQYTPWTDTGRLASEDPNMQNIPRGSRVKRAFVPDQEDQCFVYFDYSQIELRIAAHLSQDPVMLDWFRLGIDPHRQAAVVAFGLAESEVGDLQRQAAKKMNFLTIYDGKDGRLCEVLQEEKIGNFSREECKAMLAGWWKDHATYREHLNRLLEVVCRTRALVAENGRLRRLPEIQYGEWVNYRRRSFCGPKEELYRIEREIAEGRASKTVLDAPKEEQVYVYCSLKFAHAKKQAYNFPVQTLGATVMKRALWDLRQRGFTVKTTVHDSSVVQVLRSEAGARAEEVRQVAEQAYRISVPLKVDLKILNSLDEADSVAKASSAAKKQAA